MQQVMEKEELDRLLANIYDEETFEKSQGEFIRLLETDPSFRDFIKERYLSWEEQALLEKGFFSLDAYIEAFNKMAADAVYHQFAKCAGFL